MDLIKFCEDLYRIPRSITGQGVLKTLLYIKRYIPLKIKTIKSGTKVFDWVVPPEWNINYAYIIDLSTNEKVIDLANHNLHIIGYSEPIDKILSFDELKKNLYYLENRPDAIPYLTSYYYRRWGFCVSYNQFKKLNTESKYRVVIDSNFNENGNLCYGELYIKGKEAKEIFLSTYVCHSQMVNNELSGPSVLTSLAKEIINKSNNFSYRIIFIPETIGSIAYLSKNLAHLKKNVFAGFNISCVGDNKMWGLVPSRYGNTISDKVAKYVLKNNVSEFKSFTWLDRGSDERQYCSPGVDLPICCITRSKWDEYPEYHTSDDNFELVKKKSLDESLDIYLKCIDVLENRELIFPKVKMNCEPQLGKRGLYHTIKTKNTSRDYRDLKNFISYCDGTNTVLDIAELCKIDLKKADSLHKILVENDIIENLSTNNALI